MTSHSALDPGRCCGRSKHSRVLLSTVARGLGADAGDRLTRSEDRPLGRPRTGRQPQRNIVANVPTATSPDMLAVDFFYRRDDLAGCLYVLFVITSLVAAASTSAPRPPRRLQLQSGTNLGHPSSTASPVATPTMTAPRPRCTGAGFQKRSDCGNVTGASVLSLDWLPAGRCLVRQRVRQSVLPQAVSTVAGPLEDRVFAARLLVDVVPEARDAYGICE